jgi:hypothetical protein
LTARTDIRWREPWGDEPGALVAEWQGEQVELATIADALAWAAERGERVSVIVGDEVWDEVPDAEARLRMDGRIARDRERFARETRTYDEPVLWFVAVLDPDADDPEALAAAVDAEPAVVSAQVRRTPGRRDEQTWLVARVAARSREEASTAAHDAILRHVWPEARVADLPAGPFHLTAGRAGHERWGLVDYEDEELSGS